jgi:Tfp pilus assembly protein FimT
LTNRKHNKTSELTRRVAGFSLIETFVAASIIGVLTAITIPQLAGQRQLHRSADVMREIVTQLRLARQKAMAERTSFTFQYDNTAKTITIIDNNASGTAVLNDPSYPNNAGSTVAFTSSLTIMGLSSSEVSYGIPSGLPTGALSDGVSKTSLSSARINITFQPNGSVVDANGNPVDFGIFLYNSKLPNETASAVSVLGAAGRIKLWKYESGSNTYVE